MPHTISHCIGFDDAPFAFGHRGDVMIVGAVFAGLRLEGVLSGKVRRDGANSTRVIVELISRSRFAGHLQAIFVQGIAFAGFNVIDLHGVHDALGIPVIAVARKRPDMQSIRDALERNVRGGCRKWALIEQLGPMIPAAGVYIQAVGISAAHAVRLVEQTAVNSRLPEPLRTAHIIAGGIAEGESRPPGIFILGTADPAKCCPSRWGRCGSGSRGERARHATRR